MGETTLPSFLVIGAAKCGTTSICDLLASHPDVFVSDPKEPHHFSRLTRISEHRSWYESLFADADRYTAIGEGSTSYSHPHRIEFVIPRLREHLPDARIVYMVRHPVRRLESDWKMRRREGRVPASITEAVDRNASLVTFGLYWKHLSAYMEEFSDDQLQVVFLEDFAESPRRELARIYRHIGVDPGFTPENPSRKRNASRDFREDGMIVSALRKLTIFQSIKGAAPSWARRIGKIILTDDFDPEPDWDEAGLETVRSYFRDDSRKLLRYCGKPDDFWSL